MTTAADRNPGLGRTGIDSHGHPSALRTVSQKDKAWALALFAVAVLLGLVVWQNL